MSSPTSHTHSPTAFLTEVNTNAPVSNASDIRTPMAIETPHFYSHNREDEDLVLKRGYFGMWQDVTATLKAERYDREMQLRKLTFEVSMKMKVSSRKKHWTSERLRLRLFSAPSTDAESAPTTTTTTNRRWRSQVS